MTRLSNRAAVVMSAAALVMSVGFAGGPVIARSLGVNADKVDGLDAVKATASTKQRKGKLVATDTKTGQLKATVIPNDAKFPSVMPRGVTMRGAWSLDSQYAGQSGDYGSSISYGTSIPFPVSVEVVEEGGPSTTNCPGTPLKPKAAQGWLCMYVTGSNGLDTSTEAGVSTLYGVHWHFSTDGVVATGDDIYVRGTYAVTPGAAPKHGPASDHK